MRIWIELSGEHPTLPRAEAFAAMEAEGVRIGRASWNNQVLWLDASGLVLRAARRIGLAHLVCEELARGTLDHVREAARSMDLAGRRFRVRAHAFDPEVDAKAAEGALGAELGRTGQVDLTAPVDEFRLLLGEEFYLGRVLEKVPRSSFEARKVDRRSFIRPISLHPKFCRALVNLSRVPSEGTVLDPFSGTGGVLIEASSMGIRPLGGDLRRGMAEGARRSLRHLRLDADFVVADAGCEPWRPSRIHGIATDPPYGRAASTRGEPILRLYERSFAAFREILRPGSYAAVVLPSEDAIDVGRRHMELVEQHTLRVHRSLTRNFCAFVR
ncbi:MAG TPA: hypothetical protein VIB49_10650 [Thermoplasmata archaeon]